MDKNMHKISVQDGVSLYYVQNDDGTNKYIDIDVEDDVNQCLLLVFRLSIVSKVLLLSCWMSKKCFLT